MMMKATANPPYQQTAQSEEEAREATLQETLSIRRAKDEELASLVTRDRRRLRLILGLLTLMLAAAVVTAYTRRERFGLDLWGASIDLVHWPFSLSQNDALVRQRGEYGSVFEILLSDEHDKLVKPSPEPGESRAVYQREVGSLRMRVTENEGVLYSWRKKLWWFQPEWITAKKSNRLRDETVMILGRDDQDPDLYRLVLPLILPDKDGFTSLTFKSSSSDDSSLMLSSETGGRVALYSGRGSDPYALFREGAMLGSLLASVNQTVPDSKPASRTSRLPEFARHLGWCTWNAMYTNMTGSILLDSVSSLHNAEVPARWMIIDDGWQHTTNDSKAVIEDRVLRFPERLKKLDSCPEKFGPDNGDRSDDLLSLRETIRLIKSPKDQQGGGMTHVLGWHAMLGYWIGIDPTEDTSDDQWRRPAASLYYSHFSKGSWHSDPENVTSIKGVGVPNDANDFLGKYYDYMTSVGFDGVKTDVQARTGPLRPFSTEHDDPTYRHRHQVAARMLDALASNVGKFLNTNASAQSTLPVIHCMPHAPELIYRVPSLFGPRLPLMRASDDFFPLDPKSHGPMIAQTSINSMLLGHLATPDWDMFQSVLPDIEGLPGYAVSRFHAMSRSISGGPIYVSDTSDATNATLLKSVACKDGTVLPCSDVGRPIKSMLLRDPFETKEPFVIFNTNGIPNGEVTSGVLGIFQLSGSGGLVTIRPSDVEAFRSSQYKETSFLAVSFPSRKAWMLDSNSAQVDVSGEGQLWSDIVTFIPIKTRLLSPRDSDLFFDIVPLGITDKFNSAGAIIRSQFTAVSSTMARARLSIRGCGQFGFLFRLRNSKHEWDHLRSTIKAQVGRSALELVRVRLDKSAESILHGLDQTGLDLVTFNIACVDSDVLDEERWVSIDLGLQRS